MCVVNTVKKPDDHDGKFTASDFASQILDTIIEWSDPYGAVCVVFDQYLPWSLKERTREKRTKTSTYHYHVNANTDIKNMKTLLSHIETKAELTEYLAKKIICHYTLQGFREKGSFNHH